MLVYQRVCVYIYIVPCLSNAWKEHHQGVKDMQLRMAPLQKTKQLGLERWSLISFQTPNNLADTGCGRKSKTYHMFNSLWPTNMTSFGPLSFGIKTNSHLSLWHEAHLWCFRTGTDPLRDLLRPVPNSVFSMARISTSKVNRYVDDGSRNSVVYVLQNMDSHGIHCDLKNTRLYNIII